MRLWKRLSILTAVVAAITGGILFQDHQKQPLYEGYPLRHWAFIAHQTKSNSDNERYKQAVQTLWTNAVPPLLELLSSEYPEWKVKLNSTPGLRAFAWDSLLPDDHELTTYGVEGFEILGPDAACAIPALTRLMLEPTEPTSRNAAYALGCIGAKATPAIVAALTNPHPVVRTSALIFGCGALKTHADPALPLIVSNLENADKRERFENTAMLALLGIEPELCVPALQSRLRDPVSRIRYAAIEGLTKFGTNAASAVDDLASLSTDPDPIIRSLTIVALQKIAPSDAPGGNSYDPIMPAGYKSPLDTLP